MSDKKIMKRKLVVESSYNEMLKSYSATDLKEVAKKWGMKGYSKFKKDELVNALESFVLDHLEERFYIFNLDHFSVVTELMNGKNTFANFPVAANELISLALVVEANVDNQMQVMMPSVIAERFMAFYNKHHETLTFNTIIKDYMELTTSLYGVVTEEFFVESFYNFNEQAIEKEIIQSSVVYSANRTCNTVYSDGMLHYYRLAEYDKVLSDLDQKKELDYKKIDHLMLQKFVQNGNSLWREHLSNLDEVLKKHFPHKDAVDMLDELLIMAAYNHGIADYIQLFSKKEVSDDMLGLKAFADAIMTINNEIPHWELKGHAPMELSKYQKQMPIVKGEKIGRNEPCPCGSGKKYKKCCMNK